MAFFTILTRVRVKKHEGILKAASKVVLPFKISLPSFTISVDEPGNEEELLYPNDDGIIDKD